MLRSRVLAVIRAPAALVTHALIGLIFMLPLMVPVPTLRAAEFDEKVRAPEAPSNAELKARIRDYFKTYARVTAQSAAGIIRNKPAHAKWFDTQWRLQRAIDARRPLGDLSEFGIKPNGDGSYSVDIKRFPQWDLLDGDLSVLLVPEAFEGYAMELRQRGFRDQDIEAMQAYMRRNQPRQMALAENLSLSESFGAKARSRMASKRPIDAAHVMAFTYQSGRNRAEADRAWAVSLLDSLDGQRQRILESFFREHVGTMTILPDDMDAHVQATIDMIASGEDVRLLEVEKMEVQQMEVQQ